MKWLLVGLAITGCASAGKGNSIIGGIDDAGVDDAGARTDAEDFPEPDASPIDAPPQQVTLSQNVSTTIARDNTFVCFNDFTGFTRLNSYYRVFAPADHNITRMLHVTEVTFGIEFAQSGFASGLQPAQIKVGTYEVTAGATLDLTQMRTISTVDIQIADGEGVKMTVPITADIAPTKNLIVELTLPDGNTDGHVFVLGSNPQGESKPGYTRAPSCSISTPRTMRSIATQIGADEADIILTVTGTS